MIKINDLNILIGIVSSLSYISPVLAQDSDANGKRGIGASAIPEIVVESTGFNRTLSSQAQPTTVIAGDELNLKARSNLGDTLALEPGITSSSFGAGAARPVIRGLGGDRVRILENGTGTNDISAVSPDHAVTIESSLVDKVEVLRGPAALLYGTSAIGGLVNVFDNRIPEVLPKAPGEGTVELRGESVSKSRLGLASLNAPVGNMAMHVDAMSSKADDYRIPGYARTAEQRGSMPLNYTEPRGTLSWSDTQSEVFTSGGSYIFDKGFVGASYNDYKTLYGVPNGEQDVSVDAHRKRVDLRGGVKDLGELIETASIRAGIVDYNHTEFEGAEAGTRFKNNGIDARLDVKHRKFGLLEGTWGVQYQGNSFEALGEEAFQPPSVNDTYSLFGLEEIALASDLRLQFGARYDLNTISSRGFNAANSQDDVARTFDLFSQSIGAVWDATDDYSLVWSTAHTERAPNAQELFADGRHVATGVYQIGDSNLPTERSVGTDLALRKEQGSMRGSIGGFYNRFLNYIASNPNGTFQDDLPVYLFEDVPADFWGFESQIAMFIKDTNAEQLSFDLQPDYVWARNRETKDYLPRTPPLRIKVGINYYHEDLLRLRLELQEVFSQNKVADFETATDGYSMLNLYLSKDFQVGAQNYQLFLRGTNLLGEKVRNHVSFIKDVAPMPGASAMAGLKVLF